MEENIKYKLNGLTEEEIQEASKQFENLVRTISTLRNPDGGCPWDLEQTHKSLRGGIIEETYEVVDAISNDDSDHLAEELGDVLLQIVFHAQIGVEKKEFSIADVIRRIHQKMIRRHPHVFGSSQRPDSADEVLKRWDKIKEKEKSSEHVQEKDLSKFLQSIVKSQFPASKQALIIGKRMAKLGFEWAGVKEVFSHFKSEVKELEAALEESFWVKSDEVSKELSDVFFSVSQVCRKLKVDPEVVYLDGNKKFVSRFLKMIDLAKSKGEDILNMDLEQMDKLWNEAKSLEKSAK